MSTGDFKAWGVPLATWRERQARMSSTWIVGRCRVELRELPRPQYMGAKPWPCARLRVTFTSGRANGGVAAESALAVAVTIFPGRAIGRLDAFEERIRERHCPTEYYLGVFAFEVQDASVMAGMMDGYGELPSVTRLA